MVAARKFIDNAPTATLTAPINSTATSITLSSLAGFPTAFPYYATLDIGTASAEVVQVTGAVGPTATVVRNVNGLGAFAHVGTSGTFTHTAVALDFQEANDHHVASTGVHGVAGAVVGTTDAQTLTNKTLTSPTVNGATLSGTVSGSAAVTTTGTVTGATLLGQRLMTQINFDGSATLQAIGGANQMSGGAVQFDTLSAAGTDGGQANSKVTVPVGKAGVYRISGQVSATLSTGTTGRVQGAITINDAAPTSFICSSIVAPSSGATSAPVPTRYYTLADGDVIRLWIKFIGGATGSITSPGGASNFLLVEKIS